MKVYMTRNEDIFIPLQVRVAKAQKQRADLLSLSMPTPLPVVSRAVPLCLRSHQRCNQYCGKISGTNPERLGLDWWREQKR
ncbi:N-acetylmuramoyl-L-alanine amidase [Escherichia coli]|uniref:N-acetylmuramoyl-L-alanine amidase n=1 Tax=Escherichia coli TaxID=562 RepID=A0A377AFU3_ECOLX|nr:N-acetylmuramoyl-L-alanine amidase [Escherichia coli]